jgi:hypothetical protein
MSSQCVNRSKAGVKERSARLRRRTCDELSVRPILDAPPIRTRRLTREGIHLKNA